jgi:hypothetical protein
VNRDEEWLRAVIDEGRAAGVAAREAEAAQKAALRAHVVGRRDGTIPVQPRRVVVSPLEGFLHDAGVQGIGPDRRVKEKPEPAVAEPSAETQAIYDAAKTRAWQESTHEQQERIIARDVGAETQYGADYARIVGEMLREKSRHRPAEEEPDEG